MSLKLKSLLCAGLLALAFQPALQANSNCCNPCELYCGGWTLGGSWATYPENDWGVVVGYNDNDFLVDLGYSFQSLSRKDVSGSVDINHLRAHLGLRDRICGENLWFTYGVLGGYGFGGHSHLGTTANPYEVGAFTGLDYQFSRHFQISAKIAPYVYKRDYFNNTHNDVFADGSITVSYVF